MISTYFTWLKGCLVWIWEPTEPLLQIFTAFGVLRILLSLNNRLVGVWEGELQNDDYTLKATITFFKKSGEIHSWIYYSGKGHDGLRTQGVDKTIQFDDTFSSVDGGNVTPKSKGAKVWQLLKSPWTTHHFVLNCQREMLGMMDATFVIPSVRRRYNYRFAFETMTSKRLKCEVGFCNKVGDEVTIKGQFFKVR